MDIATGRPAPTLRHGADDKPHDHPIVFVQLPREMAARQVAGLLRAQVLDAAHFIALRLADTQRCVINLSYGSYCGPHDGSSLVECALDELLDAHEGRLGLVVPTGNAMREDIHAQLSLRSGASGRFLWENLPDDPSDSFVEFWWPHGTQPRLRITSPEGDTSAWIKAGQGTVLTHRGKDCALLLACGRPCQSRSGSMALLAVGPTACGTAPYGRWTIEVENSVTGALIVDAWCERDDPVFGNEAGPRQSRFIEPIERTGTLNAIAHGHRTIVVGGYTVHDSGAAVVAGPVAEMSGTGPGRGLSGRDRHAPRAGSVALTGPELLCPASSGVGEGIAAAAVMSGDEVRLGGTSVAAAFYTRRYVDNGFEPVPGSRRRLPPPPPIPDRDPHPDDNWDFPRLP